MSPIQFGIPQTRLRMYILAVKKKNKKDHTMIKWPKVKENIQRNHLIKLYFSEFEIFLFHECKN